MHIVHSTAEFGSPDGAQMARRLCRQIRRQSPEGRSPERRSPEGRCPERRSPEGRSPEGRSAERRSPERRSPERRSPERRFSELNRDIIGRFSPISPICLTLLGLGRLQPSKTTAQETPNALGAEESSPLEEYYIFNLAIPLEVEWQQSYGPVVMITWVYYLGPPGHSTSQILGTFTRFSEGFLGRERSQGGSPSVREDPLGSPPLSLPRKSLRTSRRSRESGKEKILEVRDNERK